MRQASRIRGCQSRRSSGGIGLRALWRIGETSSCLRRAIGRDTHLPVALSKPYLRLPSAHQGLRFPQVRPSSSTTMMLTGQEYTDEDAARVKKSMEKRSKKDAPAAEEEPSVPADAPLPDPAADRSSTGAPLTS